MLSAVGSGWGGGLERIELCRAEIEERAESERGARAGVAAVRGCGPVSTERKALLSALEKAASGLLFMSETDAPLTPLDASTRPFATLDDQAVRELAGHPAGDPVEVISVDELFRNAVLDQPWHTPKEREDARRFRELVALIKARLPDARVYRVGRISIDVLILGTGPGGSAIGLQTRVVET